MAQYLGVGLAQGGVPRGEQFLGRLEERAQNRDEAISLRSCGAQLKAVHRWGLAEAADPSVITQPVLVANGDNVGARRPGHQPTHSRIRLVDRHVAGEAWVG